MRFIKNSLPNMQTKPNNCALQKAPDSDTVRRHIVAPFFHKTPRMSAGRDRAK